MVQEKNISRVMRGVLLAGIAGSVLFGVLSLTSNAWTSATDRSGLPFILLLGVCVGFAAIGGLYVGATRHQTELLMKSAPVSNVQNNQPLAHEATKTASMPPKPVKKTAFHSESPPAPEKTAETRHPPISSTPPAPSVVSSPAAPQSTIKTKAEFINSILKLAQLAKECQENVEVEEELSKKEATQLSLRRREFRQLMSNVKASRFETF